MRANCKLFVEQRPVRQYIEAKQEHFRQQKLVELGGDDGGSDHGDGLE